MSDIAAQVDALVIGGGIAGLWLARALQAERYSVLVAADCIGGGQSIAAQGIIHSGVKYRLPGQPAEAVVALADMPARWRNAFSGKGNIDLTSAPPTADHGYLWSRQGLFASAMNIVSAQILQGETKFLPRSDWPKILTASAQVGKVYRLAEHIVDVPAVLKVLAQGLPMVAIARDGFVPLEMGADLKLSNGAACRVTAQRIFYAAGRGNESTLQKLGLPSMSAQRRPLKMIMAKGPLPVLFGHAIGLQDKPRVTITTHRHSDGEIVWYLGGGLAEDAARQSDDVAIQAAREILGEIIGPSVLSGLSFATFSIDRAEAGSLDGKRPNDATWLRQDRHWIGWPSKLALAPRLSDLALAGLAEEHLRPLGGDLNAITSLPQPTLALPPWESVRVWN